jgi:hypothetical protein
MKATIKSSIFIASFFVLSSAATAQSEKIQFCSDLEKAAASTMRMRQVGAPLGEVIALARKDEDKNKAASDYMINMAIKAYEAPKFASPDNQQNAITEFANKEMLHCLKSIK